MNCSLLQVTGMPKLDSTCEERQSVLLRCGLSTVGGNSVLRTLHTLQEPGVPWLPKERECNKWQQLRKICSGQVPEWEPEDAL